MAKMTSLILAME